MDLNVDTVSRVIAACCVLHNFCQVMGEDLNKERVQDFLRGCKKSYSSSEENVI